MQSIVKAICAMFIAMILASCVSMSRPVVAQLLIEPATFMVAHPLSFKPTNGNSSIVVPVGFVTDLASIPRSLWWWSAPHEETLGPAILHDFLYWQQTCSKDEADAILYVALKKLGVGNTRALGIYWGVRTPLAQKAWDRNAVARKKGEARFFTIEHVNLLLVSEIRTGETLSMYQEAAAKKGGVVFPPTEVDSIKDACKDAMLEFERMRSI